MPTTIAEFAKERSLREEQADYRDHVEERLTGGGTPEIAWFDAGRGARFGVLVPVFDEGLVLAWCRVRDNGEIRADLRGFVTDAKYRDLFRSHRIEIADRGAVADEIGAGKPSAWREVFGAVVGRHAPDSS